MLVASRNLQLLNESHELLEELHRETNELYKAGFVEAIEVDRLTLSLTSLEAQISSVERYKALSESLLKFQMGIDLSTPIELTDSLGSLTSGGADVMAMEGDAARRIEMDIINTQLALAEANIKRYKAGYAPSLAAFATMDYAAQRSTFNFFDFDQPWYPSTLVGLSLRVPIWDSFTKSAQIQKEKTNVQMILNYRNLLDQGLSLELQQARTTYGNAAEQERTLKSNLELARKILNIATIKYQEGVGSSLEVSTSQSTVLQTQSAYINALYELLIAKTDLEKALGIL
jgi:outer membrane protein TolC